MAERLAHLTGWSGDSVGTTFLRPFITTLYYPDIAKILSKYTYKYFSCVKYQLIDFLKELLIVVLLVTRFFYSAEGNWVPGKDHVTLICMV